MAILIDPPLWPAHGTLWSHLVSDAGYEELHALAAALRVPRRRFDLDHYDVPESLHARAVVLGAEPVDSRELVRRLHASGLRVPTSERPAARPVRRRAYLIEHWQELGGSLGTTADGAWAHLGVNLLDRWNEPHRAYHDERHLYDVLLALDQLAVRGEQIAPVTALAAWFHDAVYSGSSTDESDSALLAAAELGRFGLDADVVEQVAEHVLATNPGGRSADPGPPVAHLLDSDIWIFASSRQRYEEYRVGVRAEYAHVADAEFAAGRGSILRGYLARPYVTAAARGLWEARAQENLANEIACLDAVNQGRIEP